MDMGAVITDQELIVLIMVQHIEQKAAARNTVRYTKQPIEMGRGTINLQGTQKNPDMLFYGRYRRNNALHR